MACNAAALSALPLGLQQPFRVKSNSGVYKAYQAVQPSSKKVHSTHLHPRGGGWCSSSRWGQVQIKQISQQVSLGWDDSRGRFGDYGSRRCVWALNTLATEEREENDSLLLILILYTANLICHRLLTEKQQVDVTS